MLVFSLILRLRHALYDKGWKKSYRMDVPTVALGNVTVGGTGKTPHTEMIISTLLESDEWGMKGVAMLSRGYRRKSRGFQQVTRECSAAFAGDEPIQIKKKFPGITVAVDKNRVRGCRFLTDPGLLHSSRKGRHCKYKEMPPSDIIVLDDALQYRALRPSVSIVLVDWNRPVFRDRLLPLGKLRDLGSRVLKADIIILTKCPDWLRPAQKRIYLGKMGLNSYDDDKCTAVDARGQVHEVYFTCINHSSPVAIYGEGNQRYVYSKQAILFTGIANDLPLRRFLSDNYRLAGRFRFPDHHRFSDGDIQKIWAVSKAEPTAVVITTEKDAQRILDNKNVPDGLKERLFYIPIKVSFTSDNEKRLFTDSLLRRVSRPGCHE